LTDPAVKFLDNARWAAAAKIVSGGVSIILVFVLGKVLGAGAYGLFASTTSVLIFARIVGGSGLGQSTGKHLANLAPEEADKRGSYMAAGFLLQTVIALIMSAVIWFGAGRIAAITSSPAMGPALKIGAFIMVFFALTEFSKACLQGLQRFEFLAMITWVEYAGKLLLAGGLALAGFGLAGALSGFALALALASLLALFIFTRQGMAWPSLSGREWRSLVGYSLPLVFTAASFVIYMELDTIMLLYYGGPAAAGIYSMAINVARAVPFFVIPIGQSAAPLIAKMWREGDDQAPEFVHRLIKYVVACFFPAGVALFVLAPRILALMGPEYPAGTTSLRVMSVFVLSLSLAAVAVPILDYLGKAGSRAVWLTVSVSANVALNFVLIPRFGGVGAALATAITHAPYALNNLAVLARTVGLRAARLYVSVGVILAASAAAGAVGALALYLTASPVVTIVAGGVVYVGLLRFGNIFSVTEVSQAIDKVLVGIRAPISSE